MSGGVDSSVTAALLVDQGHDVVGATMKLWGGLGDSGCCSVADVVDARCASLISSVSSTMSSASPTISSRWSSSPMWPRTPKSRTPNPCVECNRHLKFGRFLAQRNGLASMPSLPVTMPESSAIRRVQLACGGVEMRPRIRRMCLRCSVPVRSVGRCCRWASTRRPRSAPLRSRKVCVQRPKQRAKTSVSSPRGRPTKVAHSFSATASASTVRPSSTKPARSSARSRARELVTVGPRRGLGTTTGERRYVLEVDTTRNEVVVGQRSDLDVIDIGLEQRTFTESPPAIGQAVLVQMSAHGQAHEAAITDRGIRFLTPPTAGRSRPDRRLLRRRSSPWIGHRLCGKGPMTTTAASNDDTGNERPLVEELADAQRGFDGRPR